MKMLETILDELLVYGAGAIGVIVGLFVTTGKNTLSFEPFIMTFIAVALLGVLAELCLTHIERRHGLVPVLRQAVAFILGIMICNAFYY